MNYFDEYLNLNGDQLDLLFGNAPSSLSTPGMIDDPQSDLPFGDAPSLSLTPELLDNPEFNQILAYLRADVFPSNVEQAPTFQNASDDFSNHNVSSNNNGCHHSNTVTPVHFSTISHNNPQNADAHIQQPAKSQYNYNPAISNKIDLISPPRREFRPRTEGESERSSHFIRCEKGCLHEYPTIRAQKTWVANKTIIQVTLVRVNDEPHLYAIENKERRNSQELFKQDGEPHTLYFYVTEKDIEAGEKTLRVEYIKGKQGGEITKEIIATEELNQSKLRFKCFHFRNGYHQADETSTTYSDTMIEKYGDFTVNDILPRVGPMRGNQKICIQTKGPIPKDYKNNLILKIVENGKIPLGCPLSEMEKNGNVFFFLMPECRNLSSERVNVSITIEYNNESIYEVDFTYLKCLDRELNENYMTQPAMPVTVTIPAVINNNLSAQQSSTSSTRNSRVVKRFRME